MKRITSLVSLPMICVGLLGTSANCGSGGARSVEVTPFKSQTGHTFVNRFDRPVYGLEVHLSNPGEAAPDPDSGEVGPFRDLRGNGTKKIRMSNPRQPIAYGDEGAIDLSFVSHARKLAVTGWWWTDENGKRVGHEMRPE